MFGFLFKMENFSPGFAKEFSKHFVPSLFQKKFFYNKEMQVNCRDL